MLAEVLAPITNFKHRFEALESGIGGDHFIPGDGDRDWAELGGERSDLPFEIQPRGHGPSGLFNLSTGEQMQILGAVMYSHGANCGDRQRGRIHLVAIDAAKQFFESPQLVKIRAAAGVKSPEFIYLDQIESGTL
jgi:hypothetical protein